MPTTPPPSALMSRVKSATPDELAAVAAELRRQIIETVAQRGGHLAPSLGVVELTLALHHVFESPRDSFVWDVGHQAYAHKLLTGRDAAFGTLRTCGGISGFPKRSESPHDAFGAGHSSTSISAALGIAEAKRMAGDPGRTIAVIGDGSMTAGLAFEGLNHAGHLQNKNLIVVLNDNQMSIDKNVGALARFMNRGITHPTYNRIRRDIRLLLSLVSSEEMKIVEMTRRAALLVKDFFLAGSLFEAFGFRYFGPVDGHDLATLIPTVKNIAEIVDKEGERSAPVLLHVITKKGMGYEPAEKDPTRFHGIGPFDPETGETGPVVPGEAKDPVPSYTQVFGDAMCDLMETDARVIAVTAAMPTGTGLDAARDRFPGRYYDVGIAEPHAVVLAAGLASRGFRPVVAIYSSFLQRAYDQIIHDVCLQNLPVIFAIDRAGVVGEDGPTHHGLFDLAYLRHIPNLAVMAPRDENELRAMLFAAAGYPGPVAIRYPRGKGRGVPVAFTPSPIPFGKAEVIVTPASPLLCKEGTGEVDPAVGFALLALGTMVPVAEAAARALAAHGVAAAVVNMRFAKPLDEACIAEQLRLGRRLVTIEDGGLPGGFGSAVVELVNDRALLSEAREQGGEDRPVIRLGYPDAFVESGTVAELHARYGLTADAIKDVVLNAAKDPVIRTDRVAIHKIHEKISVNS